MSNAESRLARIVDDVDRAVPHRRERAAVADGDEGGKLERGAVIPAFGDDFGTDSGRIAERDRKRRVRGGATAPALSNFDD